MTTFATKDDAAANTSSAAHAGETLASINPATGEIVGEVSVTPADQIPQIVARARAAQKGWRRMPIEERAERLQAAGTQIVERADELGRLLTMEMGKPLAEATGEVTGCGKSLAERTAIDSVIEALRPEILEDEHTRSEVHFDPLGVCAAISPWNFPMAMPHWLVVPSLLAGNTVVLKPSEETPLIAQAYAEILQAQLPQDVLQIVHGADGQGKALVAADVDLIAFTGSRETGMKIMESASGGLKRLILELGGKDPLIVLRDADIEKAAAFAARNSFRNAGQVCVSTERIYVDESIADEFENALIRHTQAMKVGSGMDEGVVVGPMVSASQRDKVLKQLDEAIKAGATVRYGGEGHHENFIMPTILTGLTHDFAIMKNETFGPVACVMQFRDDAEAIELANDTPFGLGAVVFGETAHAAKIGRQLEAGMIGINKSCGGASGSPWVGARQSGFGYYSGKAGHRQFTQPRVVSRPKD